MQYVRFITLHQRKVGKWMLCTPDERDAYEEAFKTAGIAYRMEIREPQREHSQSEGSTRSAAQPA